MFSSASLLYIFDYDFEDGSPYRNKYLVVLYNVNGTSIIASLTTSQDYVPNGDKKEGCIKIDEKCIHCFHLPKDKEIGENGFSFAKDTFIYIHQNIRQKEVQHLLDKYQITNKIQHVDNLNSNIYCELLECIVQGRFVPRKIKSLLQAKITDLISSK